MYQETREKLLKANEKIDELREKLMLQEDILMQKEQIILEKEKCITDLEVMLEKSHSTTSRVGNRRIAQLLHNNQSLSHIESTASSTMDAPSTLCGNSQIQNFSEEDSNPCGEKDSILSIRHCESREAIITDYIAEIRGTGARHLTDAIVGDDADYRNVLVNITE